MEEVTDPGSREPKLIGIRTNQRYSTFHCLLRARRARQKHRGMEFVFAAGCVREMVRMGWTIRPDLGRPVRISHFGC